MNAPERAAWCRQAQQAQGPRGNMARNCSPSANAADTASRKAIGVFPEVRDANVGIGWSAGAVKNTCWAFAVQPTVAGSPRWTCAEYRESLSIKETWETKALAEGQAPLQRRSALAGQGGDIKRRGPPRQRAAKP